MPARSRAPGFSPGRVRGSPLVVHRISCDSEPNRLDLGSNNHFRPILGAVLRKLSTFVGRVTGLAQPKIPDSRLGRINSAFRRRLDDAVEDVFSRACLSGDLETAGELLHVMENMHQRRIKAFGSDRRINDEMIVRARRELEWRTQSRANGSKRPG